MKKKIAVFATGWSSQIIEKYLNGIRIGTEDNNIDIYLFMCFPAISDEDIRLSGELNIFNLPNMSDFDGALVLGNSIDYLDVLENINNRCKEANIPVVFTGHKVDDGYFVGIDNYSGTRSLCEHLYFEHGIRKFFYIAGSKDNMDSNMRLKALRDVVTENGGEFSEENIYYSDWIPKFAMQYIEQWIKSGKPLPEAFVCANDEIAILVCEELKKLGVKVPRDVVVTGFDSLLFAQVYDPSICSVSQQFDKIGYESVRMLLELINGVDCAKQRVIQCKFMPGESCGCAEGINIISIRREISSNRFMEGLNTSAFYRKLSIIDSYIMRGSCYEDIKKMYKDANDAFNNYEGKSFHLILDPQYKKKMYDIKSEYRPEGYSDKMDVVFSQDGDSYKVFENFNTREIVPQIVNPDMNHLFLCLPLHESGGCIGYIVFTDDYEKLKNTVLLVKYTEQLSTVLTKFQQTIHARILTDKLIQLSETDALTQVKNRTAYQAKEEIINQNIKNGLCGNFAILLCDINDLKPVNDKFGHENGDIYIKNSCDLLKKTFNKSVVYRIGGDEFVVVIEEEEYSNVSELLKIMNDEMENIRRKNIPEWEKANLAAGIAYYINGTDNSVVDVVSRADKAMYERKKIMKENNRNKI